MGTWKVEGRDAKAFTRAIDALYAPNTKILTWTENDSRGYPTVKGAVGGALGALKTDMQILSGGEPFKTFGRITYDKQLPAQK